MTMTMTMSVFVLPAPGKNGRHAAVSVNGKQVGLIVEQQPNGAWIGYDGETRIGTRWVPTDETGVPYVLDTSIEGPGTRTEAALMLLALQGFNHDEAMQALRLGPYAVEARPVVGAR